MYRKARKFILPTTVAFFLSLGLMVSLYSFNTIVPPKDIPADSPYGYFGGQVIDAYSGTPVAGVEVVVEQSIATTNSEGRFLVRILSGEYSALFSKDGYKTIQKDIEINSSDSFDIVVALGK